MSQGFVVSQTCDVNECLHYGYHQEMFVLNNNCHALLQQPQVEQEAADSTTTLQTFISNSGINGELNDYFNMQNIEDILNLDLWPTEWETMLSGKLNGKSTPVITTDKEAAVVPDNADISCPTQVDFCGSNPFIFPEPKNLTSQPKYNHLDQNMQDLFGQIISSALTADNQVAVVPSSTDSNNNVHVTTHAAFLPVFPDEDIPKRQDTRSTLVKNIFQTNLSVQSESTVPHPELEHTGQKRGLKRAIDVHEVPTVPVPPGRKRVRKPLEIYNGRGIPQLWQFILQLLTNVKHTNDVCWTHEAPFEFKFLRPNYVAELWGKVKGKGNMNYEKLSRGIRYYYDKNIISKDHRKQHVYRFVCDIVSILGYDPTTCRPKHDSSTAANQNTIEETPIEETSKPCSTEAAENNFYSAQDQRNPFTFPKTEVNRNPGNAVFSFDKAEVVSKEIISSSNNESKIDVNQNSFIAFAEGSPFDGNQVNLFPSEFTSIPDDTEFQFSENFLETLKLHHNHLQHPGLNAFSLEGFI